MTKKEKIELVRANHGALEQAKDSAVLMIANTLPEGTLERYRKKAKGATDADSD